MLVAVSMMFVPDPRVPKFVPPITCVLFFVRPSSACHWMPNSAAFSAVISQTRTSTKTCARRTSSSSTTARRLL